MHPSRAKFNPARYPELFDGFKEDDLTLLRSHLERIHLKEDQYLFYEGAVSSHLYFVESGQVRVEKSGHIVETLDEGSRFGEIGFLDSKPQSTSIYATKTSTLYALNRNTLEAQEPELYTAFTDKLARSLPGLLRKTTDAATTSRNNEVTLLQQQNDMGHFLSYIMVILAAFLIIGRYAQELDETIHDAIYVRFTLVLTFVLCLLALKNKQSFAKLGFNLNNMKAALLESAGFTVAIILLSIPAKLLWMRFHPESNEILFHLNPVIAAGEPLTILAYCIYSPLQEFIARGCIQTAFVQFFRDRFATVRAIILSNILFCSFYFSINILSVLLLFVLGLGWGWLYSRHTNLLGVAISHTLIGIWFGIFLNLPILLR